MDSMDVLEQNLKVALNFSPMSESEMRSLADKCATYAGDGHLELFKTSTMYDGKVGRQQHGYPAVDSLPA
jgi:hypothetical protein